MTFPRTHGARHHVFTPASAAMLLQRAQLSVAAIERLREPSGKFTLRAFALTDR